MRDPKALQEWANFDDFGFQLHADLVPTIDPLTELGILLQAERSVDAAQVVAKSDLAEETRRLQIAKKDTAA